MFGLRFASRDQTGTYFTQESHGKKEGVKLNLDLLATEKWQRWAVFLRNGTTLDLTLRREFTTCLPARDQQERILKRGVTKTKMLSSVGHYVVYCDTDYAAEICVMNRCGFRAWSRQSRKIDFLQKT